MLCLKGFQVAAFLTRQLVCASRAFGVAIVAQRRTIRARLNDPDSFRRTCKPLRLVAFALVATTASLVWGDLSQAGSVPAISGSFTMTSDEGDYIGQGKSYSFPARALTLGLIQDGISVGVLTNDRWGVSLVAPTAPDGTRQRLKKGVYKNAERFADALHPGLTVAGAGRGCNESTGRFTVLDAKYGPNGYVRSLHATFEQHCEGLEPALRGEVIVAAPPPPPRLKLELTLDPSSTSLSADGIRLEGTIACTQTVDYPSVTTELSEGFGGGAVGSASISLPKCGPKPRRWQMTVASSNGIPFTADSVRLTVRAGATDAFYTAYLGESIGNVTEELPTREVAVAGGSGPNAGSDSNSSRPTWSIVVVLSIIAGLGWSLVIALLLRGRGRRQV